MGLMAFLFPGPAPIGPAPRMSLKRFYPETLIPPSDYTVIDLETTGLDACVCEILEIGAIRYRQNIEVAQYRTYIRPVGAIPKEASNINHITWRTVSDEPQIGEIAAHFFEFIGDDTIVGYNVGFDIKFIQTRFAIEISNVVFDVLGFVKRAVPGLKKYRLDDMRRHFCVGGLSHTAIGDCQATALILQKCMNLKIGKETIQRALDVQEQERQYDADRKAHIEDVKARKETEKADTLSQSELRSISKKMVGCNEDYFSKVFAILAANQRDIRQVTKDNFFSGYEALRYFGQRFFGVKTDGNLKYIVLNLPIATLRDHLICSPSSMTEGEDATRIFISNPDDIEQIQAHILTAYDLAVSNYRDLQPKQGIE